MDWDVDMNADADGFAPPSAPVADSKNSAHTTNPTFNTVERDTESATLVSNKVHIRGLDTLTTDNIKTYVRDHYGSVDRVEWIDDESANLVFGSDSAAQEALKALSSVEIADTTQLPSLETIPAKAMALNPEINLQIRFAVLSDKKVPGAAQRSRFYLFHPEFDPEERRRRNETRNRYRDRENDDRYRRNGQGRHQRDRSVDIFDAGMYDDDEETLADREVRSARRQRRSWSSDSGSREERPFANRNQEKELFPGRGSGSRGQRNRSRSPMRDSYSDAKMDVEPSRAGTASNRERASGIRGRLADGKRSKELFPGKGPSGGKTHMDRMMDGADEATQLIQSKMSVGNDGREKGDLFDIRGNAEQRGSNTGFAIKGAASANVKELFPGRFGGNTTKELFADKLEGRGKKRQKAEDLFS